MRERPTKITAAAAALLAAAALGVAAAQFGATPQENQPISRNAGTVPVEENSSCEYILKAYEGRLAVFHRGGTDPDLVFDVYVQSLPDFDRKQLQNGVGAKNYAHLIALIEDYTS